MGTIDDALDQAEAVRKLCRDLSPSLIPALRGEAALVRSKWAPGWQKASWNAIYPFDHACDFIEAVMAVVFEGVPDDQLGMASVMRTDGPGWICYDELRDYGRGQQEGGSVNDG